MSPRSSVEHPISVRFPPQLRRRAERFAASSHLGLATAIRNIVGDYLDELDARKELTRAEEWQRAQSWAAAQDVTRRTIVPETTLEELFQDQARALERVPRRHTRRR